MGRKTTLSVRLDGDTIVVSRSGDSPHKQRVSIEEAPFLVEQLMARGLHITARSVNDAWFVALARRHGFTQYALEGGV